MRGHRNTLIEGCNQLWNVMQWGIALPCALPLIKLMQRFDQTGSSSGDPMHPAVAIFIAGAFVLCGLALFWVFTIRPLRHLHAHLGGTVPLAQLADRMVYQIWPFALLTAVGLAFCSIETGQTVTFLQLLALYMLIIWISNKRRPLITAHADRLLGTLAPA